ncbi:hypothetical protein FRC12_003231 [Ceratobasidium sp. 428]|nr:hypothetical protein FRC12_003231 [Ceratobasidium sp. 428]
MAELDPTGGAKVAFSLCTKAWEHLERQEKQGEYLDELVENIAGMIPSIESTKGVADADLSQTVMAMLDLIEDLSLFILTFRPRERAWRGVINSDEEPIQTYIAKFKGLRKQFDTRVNVQALRAAEIERVYAKLRPVGQASHNPDWQCIPGTRVDAIGEITSWAQNPDSGSHFAWVRGPAGFGKSLIATSICMRLERQGVLASSFFCKRDIPELRHPNHVLTTIAFGLALRWEPYRDLLISVIRENPTLHSRHLQPLYDVLLDGPLQRLGENDRSADIPVVVVDALDECGDSVTRKQLLNCLRSLSQRAPFLRIVVTSRPDMDIQDFFVRDTPPWFIEFNLVEHDASADIWVFVREHLGDMTYIAGWPNDAVDQISRRAGGLFIWARTACKFITEGYDQVARLNQILSDQRMSDIDSLYATAISAGMLDAGGDNMACVRQCLGVVIATSTRTPQSVSNLALLLHGRISQGVLERVLRSLSSVLYVDQNRDDAIRVSHPSFMDYITDPIRSKDWCVDLCEQNTVLAERCLEIMTQDLRFNTCGLETSDSLNSQAGDLSHRVRAAILPHLGYSCLYWSSHIANGRITSVVEGHLRRFLFDTKLLYWIEALSLLGKLSTTLASLLELMTCNLPDTMQDCQVVANDAYRFVLSFYDAISRSTPHLYLSALPFAPSTSDIAQRLRGFFPKLLTVVEGVEQAWTPCLRSISLSSAVMSTSYSPDGRRIISGDESGGVNVWDAETGEAMLERLTGHSESVNSVAFSPNGRWIASGSNDFRIQLWDAKLEKQEATHCEVIPAKCSQSPSRPTVVALPQARRIE